MCARPRLEGRAPLLAETGGSNWRNASCRPIGRGETNGVSYLDVLARVDTADGGRCLVPDLGQVSTARIAPTILHPPLAGSDLKAPPGFYMVRTNRSWPDP